MARTYAPSWSTRSKLDLAGSDLYFGSLLNDHGRAEWPSALEMAVRHYDADWLADRFADRSLWVESYVQQRKTGPVTMPVSRDAHTRLAIGEFGRFYIRGVCRAAIEAGSATVRVIRLKASAQPRPESELLIGTEVGADALLLDLRGNKGRDTYNGVPGGPNSGLGVELAD